MGTVTACTAIFTFWMSMLFSSFLKTTQSHQHTAVIRHTAIQSSQDFSIIVNVSFKSHHHCNHVNRELSSSSPPSSVITTTGHVLVVSATTTTTTTAVSKTSTTTPRLLNPAHIAQGSDGDRDKGVFFFCF